MDLKGLKKLVAKLLILGVVLAFNVVSPVAAYALPYIGEIRLFAGNIAPAGWAFCDGQLLPISGNELLFQVIGSAYGGDGYNTFALPDLRGRVPIHMGSGHYRGENGGVETVTLTVDQLPVHAHYIYTCNNLVAGNGYITNSYTPDRQEINSYYIGTPDTWFSIQPTDLSTGGGQPHENMPPFLTLSYIIALEGVYPSP